MKIPGVSFSINRMLGIDKIKRNISRQTGIPMTKAGLECKVGKYIVHFQKIAYGEY